MSFPFRIEWKALSEDRLLSIPRTLLSRPLFSAVWFLDPEISGQLAEGGGIAMCFKIAANPFSLLICFCVFFAV
jgi:hypothetical protein